MKINRFAESTFNEFRKSLYLLQKRGAKKLVLDFTASWCGPCKLLFPVIKLLCEKFPELTFVKIDVDEFEEIVEERDITCMPTIQLVHNKEIKNKVEGLDVDTIVSVINKF